MAKELLTAEQSLELLELEEKEIELQLALLEAEESANGVREAITEDAKRQAIVNAYPLKQFVYDTFPVIEQGRQFKDNWHIDVICQLLQAVILGEVRNFLINQPRRTMKSLLTCVMFPAWVWTFLPHLRFLYTSYSADFAGRDNQATYDLIMSHYYQQRWGSNFYFTTEKLTKKISNSRGGFRQVFKIGKGTGSGGDFVIADDPNSVDEVESDTILDKTNLGWNEVSYHNVTDRNTAVRGIVQQRTGVNDLTGNILEDEELRKLYQVLCLPMKYESDHPNCNSPANPLYLGKVSDYDKLANPNLVVGEPKLWIDPRDLKASEYENTWYREWYRINFTEKGLVSKGEDQLLWETYIDAETVATEIAHLKVHGESSQFQQRPTPRGGNFFNTETFKLVKLESINLNNLIYIRYWDMAGTTGGGDWTVGTLVARTLTRPYKFYIIDMFRAQLAYNERMEAVKRISAEDMENYILSKDNCEYTIGIEREGGRSGKDISSIEKEELSGYDVWLDFKQVSKHSRAKITKGFAEGGKIEVVSNPIWTPIFMKRLAKYKPPEPGKKTRSQKDDEIDTIGAAIYNLSFIQLQSKRGSRNSYM